MCVEGDNFIARTSGLDTAHTIAYKNLICDLVTDGVWAKLDALYVFYTQDSTTALLNLVASNFPCVANGSPAFIADQGYLGVDSSTTIFLDTGFTPSVASGKFVVGDAHLSAWSLTDSISGVDGGTIIGANHLDGNLTQVVPRYNDANAYGDINSSNQINASVADSLGFYVVAGSSGPRTDLYKNAINIAGSTAGSAATAIATSISILGRRTNSGSTINAGGGYIIAMASIGGSLTQTDVTNFYNRFNIYIYNLAHPSAGFSVVSNYNLSVNI